MEDKVLIATGGSASRLKDVKLCHDYLRALQRHGAFPENLTIDQVVCDLSRGERLRLDSLSDDELGQLERRLAELLTIPPAEARKALMVSEPLPVAPKDEQRRRGRPPGPPPPWRVKQEQACHIRFKELQREGVIGDKLTVYDYAFQVIGRRVDSLKLLTDCQLNTLRDRLEGKPSKALEAVRQAAEKLGIENLDAWLSAMSGRYPGFAYLKGYTAQTLPENLLWRLTRCLLARLDVKNRREEIEARQLHLFV